MSTHVCGMSKGVCVEENVDAATKGVSFSWNGVYCIHSIGALLPDTYSHGGGG